MAAKWRLGGWPASMSMSIPRKRQKEKGKSKHEYEARTCRLAKLGCVLSGLKREYEQAGSSEGSEVQGVLIWCRAGQEVSNAACHQAAAPDKDVYLRLQPDMRISIILSRNPRDQRSAASILVYTGAGL